METKDIIGKEFIGFKFESDKNLTWHKKYDDFIGCVGIVEEINKAFPQYTRVTITDKKGKKQSLHIPTLGIKEQLESKEREEEEKSIDDILVEMKHLISRL
tara:strand:+ start:91 stop:393 length:303 start_codon:yes stop_codon:yes gene_type:complete